MTTKAFILIEISVGKTKAVAKALKKVEAINSVDIVAGPYDIIAIVTTDDISSIGNLVTSEIHAISGIMRTVSCISMNS